MALTANEVRAHLRHLAMTETDHTMPIPALASGESYELTLTINGDGGDFVREAETRATTHGPKDGRRLPAARHLHHRRGS